MAPPRAARAGAASGAATTAAADRAASATLVWLAGGKPAAFGSRGSEPVGGVPAQRRGWGTNGIADSVFVAGDDDGDALPIAPDAVSGVLPGHDASADNGVIAPGCVRRVPPGGSTAAMASSGTSCPPGCFTSASVMVGTEETASIFPVKAEVIALADLLPMSCESASRC
jgi:hypothetical protein